MQDTTIVRMLNGIGDRGHYVRGSRGLETSRWFLCL